MTAPYPSFGADQLATLKAEMTLFEDRLRAARCPSFPVRVFLAVAAVFTGLGYLAGRETGRLLKCRGDDRG